MNYIIKAKQSAGVVATVVDNLDSTSSIDALSANQGKILKGYISDNDTMITTLQEDVIKVEDDITKIKSNYIPVSQKGNPNGVATLDNNALLKDTQLPIASPTRLGGIKIGENLNITADGVLSATGGGSGGKEVSISDTEPTEKTIELWVDLSENEPSLESSTDSTPVGALMPYVGGVIPDKWLECDGSSVSSTDYPDLYNAIGNTFGGDSSNFKLPDIAGKFLVGLDSSDTDFSTIGKVGGEKTHTLTINEMPKHNHLTRAAAVGSASGFGDGFVGLTNSYSQDPNFATGDSGGSSAHNNMPPYFTAKYIIKAKK